MLYTPLIESLNNVGAVKLDEKRTVFLFDSVKSPGKVQYAFILGVFDNETQQPLYFVTSEVNDLAATLGGGSHFLGVFDDEGHKNLGSDDGWGDARKFFPEAIRMAGTQFGVDLSNAQN